MKKSFVLSALTLTVFFGGCGGKSNSSEALNKPPPQHPEPQAQGADNNQPPPLPSENWKDFTEESTALGNVKVNKVDASGA